jgi:carboxyl-terminal processing protease
VRDTIKTTFVTSRMIEGTNIGYVRLSEFGATAPEDLRTALQNLTAQKPKALIFDLRSNPGGYLNVAVDVASQFLKQGQVVLIEKDKNGNVQQFRAKGGGLVLDIPMVLLVNNGSASASEIISGAMRDYKRATIVGVKTYGKGSVQNVNTLSDNSELRVTIAHFFSPNDSEINEVGISPDVEIKITEDDIAKKRDPQLDKAIEILKTKIGTTSYLILPQGSDLAVAK